MNRKVRSPVKKDYRKDGITGSYGKKNPRWNNGFMTHKSTPGIYILVNGDGTMLAVHVKWNDSPSGVAVLVVLHQESESVLRIDGPFRILEVFSKVVKHYGPIQTPREVD